VSDRNLAAGSFLPLTPAVFHILLALADEDRHGYGIAQEMARSTGGLVKLGPGTLYGTLTRMTDAHLVAETDSARGTDPRRRYYRLTPLGRSVARAEADRLANLVDLARGKSLLARARR
jgi:DNA-binding PadR family transcriptional regulator